MKIRNILLLIFFVMPFLFSLAQDESNTETEPVVLQGTEVHRLVSSINGITYPIYISLPGSYNSGKKYPVVYMLDAYSSFGTMTQMVKLAEDETHYSIIPYIATQGLLNVFLDNKEE